MRTVRNFIVVFVIVCWWLFWYLCLQDDYLHNITKFIKHLQVASGLPEMPVVNHYWSRCLQKQRYGFENITSGVSSVFWVFYMIMCNHIECLVIWLTQDIMYLKM